MPRKVKKVAWWLLLTVFLAAPLGVALFHFLLALALATGEESSKTTVHVDGKTCSTVEYFNPSLKNPWRWGVTLPMPGHVLGGDTLVIIAVDTPSTHLHELEHAEQVCSSGIVNFYFRYLSGVIGVGDFDDIVEGEAYAAETKDLGQARSDTTGR